MKYLIVLLVVLLLGWLLLRKPAQKTPRRDATAAPQAMVACAHCGVHLPRADALRADGREDYYCSQAHRLAGPNGG